MIIAQINTCDYGSTGKIMLGIADVANRNGNQVFTFSRKWMNQKHVNNNHFYFGYFCENVAHKIMGRLTGLHECFSCFGTSSLIKKLKEINPDIIHIHNLHGDYINIPLLFRYIKSSNIKIIWTLHDCWPFTGHCPHFTMSGCEKWKTVCYDCPSYRDYPKSLFDRTRTMYKLKKKWFTGVENMTLVTPSEWLAALVKQSFLKEYPIKVINNGIDLSVFKPTESDFKKNYNITDKYIVLGVAFGWGKRKGLDIFIDLAKRLDKKYQIILVGTDDNVEKLLPENIISIHRTHNQEELAKIYTAADLFINPTREDNYPTVNMESIACGTPVITFNTGGSPEMLDDTCGMVVDCNDIDSLEKNIIKICNEKLFKSEQCVKKALGFDFNRTLLNYINLYNK